MKFFEHLDKAGGFYYEVSFIQVLSLWNALCDIGLAHSVGVMLPYIALAPLYLPVKTRFTFSMTLGTGMSHSNIVHKVKLMLGASAGAKKKQTLTMKGNSRCTRFLPADTFLHRYSCLRQYDELF